jgi:alkylation response protein AidB-like acyl-CoA dehydrogenase
VLAAAESDAVILTDVRLRPELLMFPELGPDGELDALQTVGFTWFELLLTAAYLGVAQGLVERALLAGRGPASERAALAVTVEGAAVMVDGAARLLDEGGAGEDGLARALVVRFAAAEAIGRAVSGAVELLGGTAFIGAPEVAQLAATVHAIGFHPPSRLAVADGLVSWFTGGSLVIG